MLSELLPDDWKEFLGDISCLDSIDAALKLEDQSVVFPERHEIFRAFELCRVNECRVVGVAQDPYHKKGQANGLAFSCKTEGKLQPSLRNIITEMERDYKPSQKNGRLHRGDLSFLGEQGVLLLNTVLTVREGKANSHKNIIGWEKFTSLVVNRLQQHRKNLVFFLWGKQAFESVVQWKDHLYLVASHPSGLSYTKSWGGHPSFKGCQHFRKCNEYLRANGQREIIWCK